uniref:Uncharacterized protein n=1 Tax=Glossina brevipalpis TaxID=37001 RepID=A0A1A9WL27_9MUSC
MSICLLLLAESLVKKREAKLFWRDTASVCAVMRMGLFNDEYRFVVFCSLCGGGGGGGGGGVDNSLLIYLLGVNN